MREEGARSFEHEHACTTADAIPPVRLPPLQ